MVDCMGAEDELGCSAMSNDSVIAKTAWDTMLLAKHSSSRQSLPLIDAVRAARSSVKNDSNKFSTLSSEDVGITEPDNIELSTNPNIGTMVISPGTLDISDSITSATEVMKEVPATEMKGLTNIQRQTQSLDSTTINSMIENVEVTRVTTGEVSRNLSVSETTTTGFSKLEATTESIIKQLLDISDIPDTGNLSVPAIKPWEVSIKMEKIRKSYFICTE